LVGRAGEPDRHGAFIIAEAGAGGINGDDCTGRDFDVRRSA